MARKRKRRNETSPNLTPRQLEILTYIRDARRMDGFSPTLQEIADHLGKSKITVFEHVEALIEKGMLTRDSNKARSLAPTASAKYPDERPSLIPLVGRIAAGAPIEAIEVPETVDLEAVFYSRHPVRMLEVTGDSMIDDQIRDGDLVAYEARSNPNNGDIVVAILNGEEATLKRFYKEKSRVRLQPANAKYKPIYTRNVEIQGVVIGVLRRLP